MKNHTSDFHKKSRLLQKEFDERIKLQQAYIVGVIRGKRNISMLILQKVAIDLDISHNKI
ncbi:MULTISPECIES: helix-turn-helix domain-containing protein [Bacillus cereus group]|uniref:helix-turn-helix domain-containing protein n=1 Tax=Bacillus cereus group TaxID=86661 RepID=UPI0009B4FCD9|nr:helix-turn-helix transcriptional regulator [Bacillus cereus]MDA1994824.1 helix-turn-helix transcriptional regulator [Bacillus cereus]MDA2000944.1 helix-turn-helix transcriptional regulator [Bacillus cereus]MDA3654129.1 helix-turn-helix transcriptional regulator [Bacillus cereus]PDZ79456.1 XRE family transcriptional regulator [Bacillus cereus]PEW28470.1 XRE family transcriptional regulator [Bacillus cereus]